MNQLFKESKNKELILMLKSIRFFCYHSRIPQFPLNFDFVEFLSNIVSSNTCEEMKIETLKLLQVLFIQPSFVEYFNYSPSRQNLLLILSKFLLQHINIEFDILILRNFINLSGGSIDERNLALNNLNFDILFEILKNDKIDPIVKYYTARLIHNYCRKEIDLNLGIQAMIKYTEVWHMNIKPDVKVELNWAIKNLRSSLKIDWIKTIKRYKMIPLFLEGCVYDNQDLAISMFYIIFQLIDDQEKVDFDFNYIKGLLSDMNNDSNIRIGCWCVEHFVKFDKSNAKLFMLNGVFAQIFYVFQTSQFDCQVDAMFALCALAKSDLIEFSDIFFHKNFIPHYLEFFSTPINYNLKVKMVSALIIIFDKAGKKGLINEAKQEFLENGGVELFNEFCDDENDDDGKLANKASLFLASYID